MYCLDTTFLIDFLKKRIDINNKLETILKDKVSITPFSVFELYYGIYKLKFKVPNFNFGKRENEIQHFIKNFQLINYNRKAAVKTAEILSYLENKGKILDIIDIMIASTAIVNDYKIIITRNERHFERIPDIQIQSYNIKKD